jgi:hypothetical protein
MLPHDDKHPLFSPRGQKIVKLSCPSLLIAHDTWESFGEAPEVNIHSASGRSSSTGPRRTQLDVLFDDLLHTTPLRRPPWLHTRKMLVYAG